MTSTEIAVAEATSPQPPASASSAATLTVSEATSTAVASTETAVVANPEVAIEATSAETGVDRTDAMASDQPTEDVADTPSGRSADKFAQRRRHIIGMTVWGIAFAIAWLTIGIPTDPIEAFIWIWAATIAWNNGKPWRTHLLFLRDWSIVIVLLVIYNISRGWASSVKPHVTEMMHADTWLLGWATGGKLPTVWLQEHLYHYQHVQWYDVLVSSVYFSHFLLALVVAAVLWLYNRDRWLSFVRRWFVLTALILATYFFYPAAPPWWAAQNGYEHDVVDRLSTRGWDAIGLHHAGSLLNAAQVQESNPVAAMPSMHSAYAMMIIVFFLPVVRKRWWPLLFCYPLAMTFALVYSGEHYVIDVLMGWAYVAVTFGLVWAGETWWVRRKAGRAAVVADVVTPEPEPVLSDAV